MADFYVEHEYWFAAIQLVLAMLGMGATLTGRDFRDVVREPFAVSLGTAIQLLAVPVTAYLFLRVLGVEGGVAVGIALIAAIPGGTVSNIFTFLARGNSALSISITALTTIACLVTTPFILSLLISQYLPPDFTMPRAQIVSEIATAHACFWLFFQSGSSSTLALLPIWLFFHSGFSSTLALLPLWLFFHSGSSSTLAFLPLWLFFPSGSSSPRSGSSSPLALPL